MYSTFPTAEFTHGEHSRAGNVKLTPFKCSNPIAGERECEIILMYNSTTGWQDCFFPWGDRSSMKIVHVECPRSIEFE